MKTADIKTIDVLMVAQMISNRPRDAEETVMPAPELLSAVTGAPAKVAWRALEREERAGRIDCGTSLNFPWVTPKGRQLLAEMEANVLLILSTDDRR